MSLHVATISGGKDSVAMCLELIRRGYKVDKIVFCDSGVEYPECYAAIERFEMLTGRKVDRIMPKHDFEYMAAHYEIKHRGGPFRRDGTRKRDRGYGWPNMARRWCTRDLKERPSAAFYKSLNTTDVVEYIGISADESNRCHDKAYPLVEWGMTSADCLRYCKDRGFFASPCAYDVTGRLSCFCCPMASDRQINYLMHERRELWARIKKMEHVIGEPWLGWRGGGLSTSMIEELSKSNGGLYRSALFKQSRRGARV